MVNFDAGSMKREPYSPGKNLFGGVIFLLIGLVISGWVIPKSELSTFWKFRGTLQTVQGTVDGTHQTGASEGSSQVRVGGGHRHYASHDRGTPIYAIDYSYTPTGGTVQHGTSYLLGYPPAIGAKVTVEYRQAQPEVSRIQGMRSATFGPFVGLLVLLFPLLGGFVVYREAAARLRGDGV